MNFDSWVFLNHITHVSSLCFWNIWQDFSEWPSWPLNIFIAVYLSNSCNVDATQHLPLGMSWSTSVVFSLFSCIIFNFSLTLHCLPMLSLSLLQGIDAGMVAGMIWCHSWAWACTALSCSAAHSDLLPSPGTGWGTAGFLGWVYLRPCLYFAGPLGRCSVRGERLCCVNQMLQILVRARLLFLKYWSFLTTAAVHYLAI